jgi:AraC family transcriptional regulator, transcriptional activator of pobA
MPSNFRTLKDFFSSIGIAIEQSFEMTVHQLKGLHGNGKKQSPQFRTDYFSFLLITAGKSSYTIDGQNFNLSKGSFYFTLPGHLKSFDIEVPIEGFMVTFTEKFLSENLGSSTFKSFPFLISESTPVMRLEQDIAGDLSLLFEQIVKDYIEDFPFKKEILSHHLSILLYKTKALLQSHQVVIKSSGAAMEIANKFKKIVDKNFTALQAKEADKIFSIKEIAAQLKLHPNYLTNVIKEVTGKSATGWIQDKTIAEAKYLLSKEQAAVQNIADMLGFTDGTHFTKYFKKWVGKTPSQFKKEANL